MALYTLPQKPNKMEDVAKAFLAYRQGTQQRQSMAQQQQRSQLENQLLQTQIGQMSQQEPMSPLDIARLRLIEAQTGQIGQQPGVSGGQIQIPEGFEPSSISVGAKGGVSQQFKPKAKPKKFDILSLNDKLFEITHVIRKKGEEPVEIEPNPADLRALQIAADQSGLELRKVPKSFAKVGRFGRIIPPTFIYKLTTKKTRKPSKNLKPQKKTKDVDITQLTDAQLDAIISEK